MVAGFKVGPDYIDPGYHTLATGRPGRNLDPYLCGEDLMAPLLLHGAQTPEPADIAVIEGVMGLFDGQIGGNGFASTAHVAGLVDAPVILVLDISHTSRTAAAIVHGLNTFDPGVRLSGVIINKAGSERHAREIIEADAGGWASRCSACCRAMPASRFPLGILVWCRPRNALRQPRRLPSSRNGSAITSH